MNTAIDCSGFLDIQDIQDRPIAPGHTDPCAKTQALQNFAKAWDREEAKYRTAIRPACKKHATAHLALSKLNPPDLERWKEINKIYVEETRQFQENWDKARNTLWEEYYINNGAGWIIEALHEANHSL
jgi:hypothetical protein